MYRKYEKTFRLVTEGINVKGKFSLDKKDQKKLLTGKITIEEKMDGANVGIIRKKDGFTLQKRRGLAEEGVHPQFSFFWNWARNNQNKIEKIPKKFIVYGELMFAKHMVPYHELPSYFLAYDVWTGKEYLNYEDRMEIVQNCGFKSVPLLFQGHLDRELEYWLKNALYAPGVKSEGIVVKNYKKQMRGKLVRPEFLKRLEEDDHWMKGPLVKNSLIAGANVYD